MLGGWNFDGVLGFLFFWIRCISFWRGSLGREVIACCFAAFIRTRCSILGICASMVGGIILPCLLVLVWLYLKWRSLKFSFLILRIDLIGIGCDGGGPEIELIKRNCRWGWLVVIPFGGSFHTCFFKYLVEQVNCWWLVHSAGLSFWMFISFLYLLQNLTIIPDGLLVVLAGCRLVIIVGLFMRILTFFELFL